MLIEYTPEFVERGYNNRAAVPDHPRWLARFAERRPTARAALAPKLDLRYGAGPEGDARPLPAAGPARGTFVFLHGGYWRALDKSDFSFVAAPFVARGYAVAVVNYDLCPDVSIAAIVDEAGARWRGSRAKARRTARMRSAWSSADIRRADTWRRCCSRRTGRRGPRARTVPGGVSLSGVHDLAPMVQFSFNADFKLDAREAARSRPCIWRPDRAPRSCLRSAPTRRRNSSGRRGSCGTPGPQTGPRAPEGRCDPRPQPFRCRRRFRGRRQRAHAGHARAVRMRKPMSMTTHFANRAEA